MHFREVYVCAAITKVKQQITQQINSKSFPNHTNHTTPNRTSMPVTKLAGKTQHRESQKTNTGTSANKRANMQTSSANSISVHITILFHKTSFSLYKSFHSGALHLHLNQQIPLLARFICTTSSTLVRSPSRDLANAGSPCA